VTDEMCLRRSYVAKLTDCSTKRVPLGYRDAQTVLTHTHEAIADLVDEESPMLDVLDVVEAQVVLRTLFYSLVERMHLVN
jgi:hypothetical protein